MRQLYVLSDSYELYETVIGSMRQLSVLSDSYQLYATVISPIRELSALFDRCQLSPIRQLSALCDSHQPYPTFTKKIIFNVTIGPPYYGATVGIFSFIKNLLALC